MTIRVLLNGLNQRPGGGLVVLEAIIRGLLSRDARIRICAVCFHSDSVEELSKINNPNFQVIQVERTFKSGENFVLFRHLRRFIRSTGADVVIGLNHLVPLCPVPQIIYHVNLSRFQREIIGFNLDEILHRIRDWSARSALKSADGNVFESNYLYDAAKLSWRKQIKNPSVIYIGVDDRYVVSEAAIGKNKVEPIVSVITNQEPYKRNYLLIPILAHLKDQFPDVDWRFKIFGGIQREEWAGFESIAKTAGVSNSIELMGYQPREYLTSVLDKSTCLLMTSSLESFCMVALEAMARGCPAIVGKETSMPESVGDGGIVMEVCNTKEVSKMISDLYFDPKFHNEQAQLGYDWARNMTWSHSGQHFFELVKQAVRG